MAVLSHGPGQVASASELEGAAQLCTAVTTNAVQRTRLLLPHAAPYLFLFTRLNHFQLLVEEKVLRSCALLSSMQRCLSPSHATELSPLADELVDIAWSERVPQTRLLRMFSPIRLLSMMAARRCHLLSSSLMLTNKLP